MADNDHHALGPAPEETHCLRSVVAALNATLLSLTKSNVRNADVTASAAAMISPADGGPEFVGPDECIEFIKLAEAVIVSCDGSHDKIQALLFDAPFDLTGTLTNVVAAKCHFPASAATARTAGYSLQFAEQLNQMRAAALSCVKKICSICAEDDLLARLLRTALRTSATLPVTFALLSDVSAPVTVRLAASELAFVACLRLDCTGALRSADFDSLINAVSVEPNADIRAFLAGTARNVVDVVTRGEGDDGAAADDPERFSALRAAVVAPATHRALLKLVALDDTQDVRCLCSHMLCTLMRSSLVNGPPIEESDLLLIAETTASRIANVATSTSAAAGHRAELPDDEEAEALLGMLQCSVDIACAGRFHTIFNLLAQSGVAKHLVRLLLRAVGLAALAARTLRCLMEYAPSTLCVAPQLVTHVQLAPLLKTLMAFDLKSSECTVPEQMLCVEVSIVVGIVFLHSPMLRRKCLVELHRFPSILAALNTKTRDNLQAAALDYYEEILVVDASNVILNDDRVPNLDWVDEANLSVDSIRLIVESQELRPFDDGVLGGAGGAAPSAHWHNQSIAQWHDTLDVRERGPDMRRGYLAFVLLGYAAHLVFTNAGNVSTVDAGEHVALLGKAAGHTIKQPHFMSTAGQREIAEAAEYRRATAHASAPRGRHEDPMRDPLVTDYSPTREGLAHPASHQRQHRSVIQDRDAAQLAAHAMGGPAFPRAPASYELSDHPGPAAAAKRVAQRRAAASRASDAAPLRVEFDACLRLVLHFAQHFSGPSKDATRRTVYAPDAAIPGLVARKPAGATVAASGNKSKLTNPWQVKRHVHNDPKKWTVNAVEEGDLFFFSVPLQALTASVVEAIINKARAHFKGVRKAVAVAPHTAKNRRHFLEDMLTAVMPSIINLLTRLQKFLASCTDAHVQMALTLLPSVASSGAEKCIDCGNVVNVVDYLAHYFSKHNINGGQASSTSDNKTSKADAARASQHAAHRASPEDKLASVERYLQPHGMSVRREASAVSAAPLFPDASPRSAFSAANISSDDSD